MNESKAEGRDYIRFLYFSNKNQKINHKDEDFHIHKMSLSPQNNPGKWDFVTFPMRKLRIREIKLTN